jgi:hypothetical protein
MEPAVDLSGLLAIGIGVPEVAKVETAGVGFSPDIVLDQRRPFGHAGQNLEIQD